MPTDGELLRQYVDGSDAAFTALVHRHLNLVFRTALRRLGGDAHAAEDVAQRVFTSLARKSGTLRDHPSVVGWLHTSARFASAEYVRGEQRRRVHEREAHMTNVINGPEPSPGIVDDCLDEVLATLGDREREAVLLHFFEGRTFVDVAASTASTADATRMRVNRALDRLRDQLERRGVVSAAAALSATLGAASMHAATLPDAVAIAQRALAPGAAGASGASVVKTIAPWAAGAAFLITAGVIIRHQHHTPVAPEPARQPALVAQRENPAPNPGAAVLPQPAMAPPPATRPAEPAATPVENETDTAGGLAPAEVNLLATLWDLQQTTPQGHWVTLTVGNGAPNWPGIEPLLNRGFVTDVGSDDPRQRRVHLSRAGLDYCKLNRAALESFTPITRLAPTAAAR